MPPIYDWFCDSCGETTTVVRSMDFSSQPPDKGCTACEGGDLRRLFGANLNMVASLDGTKRGGGYQEMKEAARLECVKVNMPQNKRADIQREINKLKKVTIK